MLVFVLPWRIRHRIGERVRRRVAGFRRGQRIEISAVLVDEQHTVRTGDDRCRDALSHALAVDARHRQAGAARLGERQGARLRDRRRALARADGRQTRLVDRTGRYRRCRMHFVDVDRQRRRRRRAVGILDRIGEGINLVAGETCSVRIGRIRCRSRLPPASACHRFPQCPRRRRSSPWRWYYCPLRHRQP